VNWRIAIVSDGFPHYVHLITEHMIWQAFDDDTDCEMLGIHHYQLGLRKAIQQINVELKRPYEKAVLHRNAEWEDIVWATADGEDLIRQSKDIQQSYLSIIERRKSPVVFENGKFAEALRRLRADNYGAVLEAVPQRQGAGTHTVKRCCGVSSACRQRRLASNSTARCHFNVSACTSQRTCEAATMRPVFQAVSACAAIARNDERHIAHVARHLDG
jgi:hypothetical protein